MTPERFRELMAITGDDRLRLSRLLGYASENSLRQFEKGLIRMSPERSAWLERYAKVRARANEKVDEWVRKNPVRAGKQID